MRLVPFDRVDGTPFSARPADIVAAWGEPVRLTRNGVNLHEWDYGDVVFRFQESGRLEEITKQARVVHLGGIAVPFAALADFVRRQDPRTFERADFVVSPAYGMAFVPACPFWVTALARHCIDAWRAIEG
jgi:hypothetical protein